MTMEELRHVRLAGLMQGEASRVAHSRADRVPVADTMPSKLLGPVFLDMVGGMAEFANLIGLG